MDDTAIEAAEDQTVNVEEDYLNEILGQLPAVRRLIRIAEGQRVMAADSGEIRQHQHVCVWLSLNFPGFFRRYAGF